MIRIDWPDIGMPELPPTLTQIADTGLHADLADKHPAVAARCAKRADFMKMVIGLDVADTLLPLADTCGTVVRYLLDPTQVIAL